jgi:hypothetical protein
MKSPAHVIRMLALIALMAAPTGHSLAATTSAGGPANTATRPGASSAAKAASAKPKTVAAKSSTVLEDSSARPGGGPRRLEDIHIAGEIPVPQVLFVTARDQRRFMDSKHRQYLRTARQVAEATPLPSSVIVTRPEPPPGPR